MSPCFAMFCLASFVWGFGQVSCRPKWADFILGLVAILYLCVYTFCLMTKLGEEYIAYYWYIFRKGDTFLLISLHCLFPNVFRMEEVIYLHQNGIPVQHRNMCSFLRKVGCHCICGIELHNECTGERIGNLKRVVSEKGILQNFGDIRSLVISGVEIALLLMERDVCKDFVLPRDVFCQWRRFELPDTLNFQGEYIMFQNLPLSQEVFKIGKKTGFTKGVVTSKNKTYRFKKENLHLENQLEIKWGKKKRFSGKGDSGSAVFTIDRERKTIKAVGILTGLSSSKRFSIVTPISEIFYWLGFDYRLRPFTYRVVTKYYRIVINGQIRQMKRNAVVLKKF